MRKILVFGFATLLLGSCASTEDVLNELSDELNIPDRIASGRATAFVYSESRTDSSEIMVDYQYFTPQFSSGVMDSSYKDSVNQQIERFVTMERLSESTGRIGPMTDYYFENFINEWAKDAQEEAEYLGSTLFSLNMGFEITTFPKYVELRHHAWSYLGGAHGNGYTTYTCFHLKTGEKMYLEDFFNDITELNRRAEVIFRREMDIPEGVPINDAGLWFDNNQFALNENFCFRGDTLSFVYNSYEIAPYAAGPILLEIPLSELEGLMK